MFEKLMKKHIHRFKEYGDLSFEPVVMALESWHHGVSIGTSRY